ncbi:MAG: patatin-like phospholipase family protein [Gemmatimonadales bacterium]
MTRRATLVLSGGGAKGAFQVGAEQVLREEGGFEWERIFGVSVGALNGALLAQREYARLLEVWRTVRREDLYRKPWWLWIPWRLVILRKAGIYDNTPLRATIQKRIAGRPFLVPLHVGRVSLVSGAYESVRSDQSTEPEMLDAIWQSATMAVIWEPIGPRALVDGSLRNVTPLGDALDLGATELIVLNCTPDQPDFAPRPRDILDAARRSLMDITINEIMVDDVREFVRINKLVKQAKRNGFTLEREDGTPYLDCTIGVLRPRVPLGDNLDFSRTAIDERIESGRQMAREYLAGVRVPV